MLWKNWMYGPQAAFRDKEDDPGGGGGKPDVAAQIQGLKAKYGSAQAALAALYQENYQLREQRRELKTELAEAKLPEGAVVLSADEGKVWESYKALGKPEDVKKGLDAKDELEQKVARAEHEKTASAAARVTGYKADVLLDMPGAKDLKFEVRKEEVDGEEQEVAYVTGPKEGSTPQKLADHAEAEWSKFLPALEAGGEEEKGAPPAGALFPQQKPTGRDRARGGAASAQDIEERKRGSRRYVSI